MKKAFYIFCFSLGIILFNSCGPGSSGSDTASQKKKDSITDKVILDSLGCEKITKSSSFTLSTGKANQKTIEYDIIGASKLNLSDEIQMSDAVMFFLSRVYDDTSKLGTDLSQVNLNFSNGDKSRGFVVPVRDLALTIADYYSNNKDEQGMLKWCGFGLKKYPGGTDFHELIRSFYIKSDNFKEALKQCKILLELKPDEAEYQAITANCYLRLDSLKKANELIEKCIEKSADYDYAYVIRGRIYSAKKEYDKAEKDFLFAVRMDSLKPRNLTTACRFYLSTKKYDKALLFTNKIFAADSLSAEPYFLRGLVFLAKKDKTKACGEFKKAIEFGSDSAKFYLEKTQRSQ